MAATTNYRTIYNKLWAGSVNWGSDDIRAALVTSTYTPNGDTDQFWSTPVANEASGTGYTANGVALASKTSTYTAANSWGTSWAATTAYGSDTTANYVRPTTGNGFVYRATGSGTSGASEPTWPTTIGATVVDSGVTWTCIGRGIQALDAADPSWTGLTLSFRYLVIYDRTPASDATRPLICYVDLGAQSLTASNFSATFNSQGLILIPVA